MIIVIRGCDQMLPDDDGPWRAQERRNDRFLSFHQTSGSRKTIDPDESFSLRDHDHSSSLSHHRNAKVSKISIGEDDVVSLLTKICAQLSTKNPDLISQAISVLYKLFVDCMSISSFIK